MTRTTDYIRTYSGIEFYPYEPRVEDVNIADIAHALSLICRFNGHTVRHYSIAQHSIYVSAMLEGTGLELKGLFHDASEAYICDIPRPLKKHTMFNEYKKLERDLQIVIYAAFGLDADEPAALWTADDRMLRTEQRDLMPRASFSVDWSGPPILPYDFHITPYPMCADAEYAFLDRYNVLTEQKERV